MGEILVRAEGLSKKFCKDMKRSMFYGIRDISKNIIGILPETSTLKPGEFWAIDDVSFELGRGECLGLIGPNGSGKSTLLKMLNGIISPDRGKVEITGRTGVLIEIGAGFHPMLTGKENIYVNGSILGFSKKEITRRFDEIVEFAGLEDFINTAVKYYSSGMRVRLGFAIAAQMEPDVLLIDEVLAVGDMGFRAKCYKKISEMSENCAVIFVSHSMSQVAKLCNDTIVLNQGNTVYSGNTNEAIVRYNNLFPEPQMVITGLNEAEITNLKLLNNNNMETDEFYYYDPLFIAFDVDVSEKHDEFKVSVTFMDQSTNLVAQCHSEYNCETFCNNGKKHSMKIEINPLIFNTGKYYVNIIIFDKTNTKPLIWLYAIRNFSVKGDFHGGAPVQLKAKWHI